MPVAGNSWGSSSESSSAKCHERGCKLKVIINRGGETWGGLSHAEMSLQEVSQPACGPKAVEGL